ncbi:FG-GAP-like repeat-containing protein [Streptomyces exfoliatus]|uniref:FG-GAP-like repeat-containing protein n=1 Tax=Streptomyces exfoliatus TaxID=1905 RepID=UPI0004C50FF3|nr:FG-GAP-like repeat-containing protein [Streptomyces exfoliatus]
MRPDPSARLLRGALTTGVALGLSATALSSPARASDGWDRCPDNAVCGFSQPLHQGDMIVIRKPMPALGSWDNRIRSYVVKLPGYSDAICLHPKPGLDPEGATHSYFSESFDESAHPELDRAVSSVDIGPDADDFCGTEGRYPGMYDLVNRRPATLPATGDFGDLNGDGFADVVTRNMVSQLWVSHDYTSGSNPQLVGGDWSTMTKLVRHGDYDGDGNEDVFARDRSGVLWRYPGTGRGLFKPRVKIGGGWNTMRDLAAVGDLTGDGKGDLLASDGDGVLWTYPGNGRGWFGARKMVGGGWKAINELVGAGDMNTDGRADLVARDTAGRLWLYPGNGRGWFGARTIIGTGGWNSLGELAGIGDVNGDGKADIVAHTPDPDTRDRNRLRVYNGTGDGHLRAPWTLASIRTTHYAF